MLIGLSACGSPPAATVPPATAPVSTSPIPVIPPSTITAIPPIITSPVPPPVPVSTPTPGPNVTIDLVAQSLSFNMSTITVPAGASVTVNFNNKDSVSHNFAVYQNLAGGQTKPIFVGSIITGPGSAVYIFTAPAAAGSYFFECDVHPQSMNGTFVVTVP